MTIVPPMEAFEVTDRSGDAWSSDDVALLAALYFAKPRPPSGEIAIKLGRSVLAVQSEISRQGMARPGAKLRTCVGVGCCGERQFFSTDRANRICPRCSQDPIYRYAS